MKTIIFVIAAAFAISSCIAGEPQEKLQDQFAAQLGKQITVVGEAQSLKEGARICGKNFCIYIDGLDSWPSELYGKQVSVTGIVIERHDLPVYVPRRGDLPQAARAVRPGTDLRKAAHRYLLKDAKWKPQ